MKPHPFQPHPGAPQFCAYMEGEAVCHRRPEHGCHAERNEQMMARLATAAYFTTQDLALIRATILRVIDGGDPKRSANVGCVIPWDFYGSPEWDANEQRLRFVDRIQELIVGEAKEDETRNDTTY
jgi:hypothetical protein